MKSRLPDSLLADTLTLAPLFRAGAVLQHGKPVPVWGTARSGDTVRVCFAGQTVKATADPDGRWLATLAPLVPSSIPADLTVTTSGATRTVRNVLVGIVWLASGQSNMVWTVGNSRDGELEILSAHWPLIREIKIDETVADEPATEVSSGGWLAASPETVSEFSGIAYSFARELHQILDLPVGIINAAWGSSSIEAWMPPEAWDSRCDGAFGEIRDRWEKVLENYPERLAVYEKELAQWEAERDAAQLARKSFKRKSPQPPPGPGHQTTPSGLYNGMIHPLVPYALCGIIWYQGENNAVRHHEYRSFFIYLITSWRARFREGDLPFYWAQLSRYFISGIEANNWALLREAQTRALALPATGQAVTIDIGNTSEIHPRNKLDVGRRLARLALNRLFDRPIVDSGPVFSRMESVPLGLRLHFIHTAQGLCTPDGLSGFEIAGADRKWVRAEAEFDDESIIVRSSEVSNPVAARYAWMLPHEAGLFNSEYLPAVPFRTVDW
jgi:sialate O-acetylesterase